MKKKITKKTPIDEIKDNPNIRLFNLDNIELFDFIGFAQTNFSNITVFRNQANNAYIPIILDFSRFSIAKNFTNRVLELQHCGLFSLLLGLISQSNLRLYGIYLNFHEEYKIPLVNLILVDQKNKVQEISHVYLLPEDAALCSILYGIPLITGDETTQNILSFPTHGLDDATLLNTIQESVVNAENNLAQQQKPPL